MELDQCVLMILSFLAIPWNILSLVVIIKVKRIPQNVRLLSGALLIIDVFFLVRVALVPAIERRFVLQASNFVVMCGFITTCMMSFERTLFITATHINSVIKRSFVIRIVTVSLWLLAETFLVLAASFQQRSEVQYETLGLFTILFMVSFGCYVKVKIVIRNKSRRVNCMPRDLLQTRSQRRTSGSLFAILVTETFGLVAMILQAYEYNDTRTDYIRRIYHGHNEGYYINNCK
ncbi:hypothetical protein DPMN_126551, partial [Dreissena polymorpha]